MADRLSLVATGGGAARRLAFAETFSHLDNPLEADLACSRKMPPLGQRSPR